MAPGGSWVASIPLTASSARSLTPLMRPSPLRITIARRKVSTPSELGARRHGIAGSHPRLDTPLEGLDLREPLPLILRRLTGGGRLGGSGAVKDDLLVSG